MTKQEREYVQKIEKLNALLQERVKHLEDRLKYEDPVAAINPPPNKILF